MPGEAAAPALPPLSPLPRSPSPPPPGSFLLFLRVTGWRCSRFSGVFHVLLVWLGGLLPWRAHWAQPPGSSPRSRLCSPEMHARPAGCWSEPALWTTEGAGGLCSPRQSRSFSFLLRGSLASVRSRSRAASCSPRSRPPDSLDPWLPRGGVVVGFKPGALPRPLHSRAVLAALGYELEVSGRAPALGEFVLRRPEPGGTGRLEL